MIFQFLYKYWKLKNTDTLIKYKINITKNLKALTHQSGNWSSVSNYYKIYHVDEIKTIKANKIYADNSNLSLNDINESINKLSIETNSLLEKSDKTSEFKLNQIKQLISESII